MDIDLSVEETEGSRVLSAYLGAAPLTELQLYSLALRHSGTKLADPATQLLLKACVWDIVREPYNDGVHIDSEPALCIKNGVAYFGLVGDRHEDHMRYLEILLSRHEMIFDDFYLSTAGASLDAARDLKVLPDALHFY